MATGWMLDRLGYNNEEKKTQLWQSLPFLNALPANFRIMVRKTLVQPKLIFCEKRIRTEYPGSWVYSNKNDCSFTPNVKFSRSEPEVWYKKNPTLKTFIEIFKPFCQIELDLFDWLEHSNEIRDKGRLETREDYFEGWIETDFRFERAYFRPDKAE